MSTQTRSLKNYKIRLAEGLSAWLTFEFKCDRGYLFSEYYLAYPIGQLLRGVGDSVYAEEPHPTLAVPGRVGRPQSLDFVVKDGKKRPLLAVETKWAGFGDVTSSALIWDAFRLEASHRKTGAPGLLVLGGTTAKLRTLFASAAFQRTGRHGQKELGTKHPGALTNATPSTPARVPLLPLGHGPRSHVLNFSSLPKTVQGYIDKKKANCAPGVIAEKLYAGAPQACEQVRQSSISFSVYVWEIRSCD